MQHTTSTPKKDAGSIEDKPVTTEVTVSGEHHVIKATHHIVSDAGVLSLYLGSRSEGIDIQIIDGTVLCRSERARDRLGMHASTDAETGEEPGTDTHVDKQRVMTDGGVDVKIVEGQPDPDDAVSISLMYDGNDWCVSFESLTNWSQNDLEPWLSTRLDAPETIAEAKGDDRAFVPEKEHIPARMQDVSFHQDVLARGEYDSEANTWTMEVLV